MALMFEVTQRIDGANDTHPEYPLLPNDLLAREDDGTWTKVCPGLCIMGFVLSIKEIRTLRAREIYRDGLNYYDG